MQMQRNLSPIITNYNIAIIVTEEKSIDEKIIRNTQMRRSYVPGIYDEKLNQITLIYKHLKLDTFGVHTQ